MAYPVALVHLSDNKTQKSVFIRADLLALEDYDDAVFVASENNTPHLLCALLIVSCLN